MNYDGNDFYCDVALKDGAEIKKEYESDNVLAFHHTKPYWPVHIVVIPKKHIPSFTTISEEERSVVEELFKVIQQIIRKVENDHGAARILTNLGEYQDSKHFHVHVSSGAPIK